MEKPMQGREKQYEEMPTSPFILPEHSPHSEKALAQLRLALGAAEKFIQSELAAGERLRQLQYVSQSAFRLPGELLESLAEDTLQPGEDLRIRGEMCYALGRSGRPSFITQLQPLLRDPDRWVKKQATNAVRELEDVLPDRLEGEEIDELRRLGEELKAIAHTVEPPPDEYTRQVYEEAQRNREAYERQEPELLEEYVGQFVAFCDGELVTVGPNKREVTLKAMQARPMSRPYVRRVGEDIPSRLPGRR
jgi:hypothetical protein